MRIILLSGGSGRRLWPLSNDSRSKQFLKVLTDPRGNPESMIQRVWRQLLQADLQTNAVVATSRAQVDILYSQIGASVPLVIEPERRDTFPAVALSVAYLSSVEGVGRHEAVAVLPVDSHVEDHFFCKVMELRTIVQSGKADLALIGVEPTLPSSKYGYIVPQFLPEQAIEPHLRVSHFQEKPSEEQATWLLLQGALWNCGVFAFRIGWMLDHIESLGLPTDYEKLRSSYGQLPRISFDHQVVEKTRNVSVLPYDGSWKDLGTWNTLTEEMDANLIGKGTISADSHNTHLINELDIPVAVLGISDAVVAVSPDGILVSDKAASPRLKEVLTIDQRPMYEECPWGWYRVIDYNHYDSQSEMLTRRMNIHPGKKIPKHLHNRREELWLILYGEGEAELDGDRRMVREGDTLLIPPGTEHALQAHTRMEVMEIQRGMELTEEDYEEPIGEVS
ncbi:sugar phosphate nucleotidyltransferase [Cohnella thailandensis]|uniref:Cupin domain-containing protein n=1 Tax=Cohnella thailandensis TaxID=557557 RepID=A0A841T5C0_9BACL|nr:sugar phosphate nucleotidyltransferase [Cohnella thailandensis]MBB6638169.1 cupin domain-containing protein [Cohnella thailandensis]MBP1971906.1 mannose-1-phosphate guanylyltransferase [Cohnella thailandensis]